MLRKMLLVCIFLPLVAVEERIVNNSGIMLWIQALIYVKNNQVFDFNRLYSVQKNNITVHVLKPILLGSQEALIVEQPQYKRCYFFSTKNNFSDITPFINKLKPSTIEENCILKMASSSSVLQHSEILYSDGSLDHTIY